MSRNMFENKSFAGFKQRFFSKFSKKLIINSEQNETTKDEAISRSSRSSSMCSIRVATSEDLVEESMAKGLPIIPFGFPTFVIAEENHKMLKDNNLQNSIKNIKEKITRQVEENVENKVNQKKDRFDDHLYVKNQKVYLTDSHIEKI